MQPRRKRTHAITILGLLAFSVALAQDGGNWRAASSTARSITGDIAIFNQKIALGFTAYPLAQIRLLKPDELTALFSGADASSGSGNLYRVSIPGDKRFLHKNTLCGSEETQWVATFAQGKNLQMALFSGPKMPVLTPEGVANTTDLCGTFSYVR